MPICQKTMNQDTMFVCFVSYGRRRKKAILPPASRNNSNTQKRRRRKKNSHQKTRAREWNKKKNDFERNKKKNWKGAIKSENKKPSSMCWLRMLNEAKFARIVWETWWFEVMVSLPMNSAKNQQPSILFFLWVSVASFAQCFAYWNHFFFRFVFSFCFVCSCSSGFSSIENALARINYVVFIVLFHEVSHTPWPSIWTRSR